MHACMLSCFSCVQLFATLGTVACQPPLSMGISRQESWSWLLCPPPGHIPWIEYRKGSIITLQWRNLASTALTNWWRVTSAVIKHFYVIYPLIKHYKTDISLPWYSSQDIHCNPSLHHNKASDKPTLNILQNTCPVLLKNVKVLKNKGSEQLSQPRGA